MANKLRQIINKGSDVLIAALVIGIFSLISLTWYGSEDLIGAGDSSRYINLGLLFKSMGSSWNSKVNTGALENYLMYHIPYSMYFVPLRSLGVNEVVTQKFFVFLTLFAPGFSMYLFLKVFVGSKVQNIIKISVSLFYIFNPITMLLPLALNLPKLSVYVSLPILSLLLVSIFRANKMRSKLILTILLSLSTALVAPAFVNIAEVTPIVIVPFFLFLYEMVQCKEKKLHLGLFVLAITIGILINAWWITSSLFNIFGKRDDLVGSLAC